MALAIGNKTFDINTPSASSRTFSHNQNTGSDSYLFVLVACPATTVNSVTYAGIPMTLLSSQTPTVYGTEWSFWQLSSPSTGANNVVVSFAAAQFNPTSCYVISTTGSAGSGSVVFDDTAVSPNTTNITVSSNSIVMGALIAGNNVSHNITIDGSSRTLDFTHNINNFTSGALSAVLTSGSKSISISGNTSLSGFYMEITEAAGGSPTGDAGDFFFFF
jgi:hypothetical protein